MQYFILFFIMSTFTSSAFSQVFENGNFENIIDKVNNNGPWQIQDSTTGRYSGLVTQKFDHFAQNHYLEIESHNSTLGYCNPATTNCHRVEVVLNQKGFDRPVKRFDREGARTKIFFKFKVDQLWDFGEGDCNNVTCYFTMMQYVSSGQYAVAPMMSFVIARYKQSNFEPSVSFQHKIHCDKPSNKTNYPSICNGRNGIVHWSSDTFIPIKLGVWYEAYSHVYWKEAGGIVSAGSVKLNFDQKRFTPSLRLIVNHHFRQVSYLPSFTLEKHMAK